MNSRSKYIKVVDDLDPIAELKDQVCFCIKTNGKSFSAKLIGANDDELWFKTRSGDIIMNRRNTISSISNMPPREEAV